jgi:hypothetical protein
MDIRSIFSSLAPLVKKIAWNGLECLGKQGGLPPKWVNLSSRTVPLRGTGEMVGERRRQEREPESVMPQHNEKQSVKPQPNEKHCWQECYAEA